MERPEEQQRKGRTKVENQKITFTWDGSLPESAVLGNELTLPKPVTVDENRGGASVQTYTAVEVKYHNG